MQPLSPAGVPFAVAVGPVRAGDDPTSGVRLRVRGEVDLATAPFLRAALAGALGIDLDPPVDAGPGGQPASGATAAGTARVELDLSEVSFLDARGVAVLVRAGAAARAAGGHLRLRAPRPLVRRVLELTGADALCELVG